MNMLEINVQYRIALKKAIISLNHSKFFRNSVSFAMAIKEPKYVVSNKNICLLKKGRLNSNGNA